MSEEIRPRPNVLFVICDQLRADHLGFAGDPVVRTPHIDAIAARGTVFDRAHVSNPVCMPNRSTIMTGRMPSAHGVVFNDRSLDPGVTTFVGRLREAGWRTALVGKSHLQHGLSREAIEDLGPAGRRSAWDEGWDTVEHQERYAAGEVVTPDDFYGFGRIDLTIGHGAQVGGHHYLWALDRGVPADKLRIGLDASAEIDGRSPHWWQVHPAPFAADASSTTFVTERTMAFIDDAVAAGDPWMTWCSFPDPHHPMAPPEPWFSRHAPADMELPATFATNSRDVPGHLEFFRRLDADPAGRRPYVVPFGPDADTLRAAKAATYGMIEAIDDGIGRIMARIAEHGQLDDTIVVFTSDHGDMMGDHGVIGKGAMHYGGCTRVPMVISRPGDRGARSGSLASSIDLPSTLLELCGLVEHQGMQGCSLVPLLDDPTAAVRESILVEDDFPAAEVQRALPHKTRTVITDTHRYTRDSNGYEALYDLVDDPDEVVNLAVDGRAPIVRAEQIERLADALMHADDMTRYAAPTVDLSATA